MAEEIVLSEFEVKPQLVTTGYRVALLHLDVEHAEFVLHLRGTNGELKEIRRTGAAATTLMRALNTADLSVKSLQRRALEWAVAQGEIAGTVNGTPDA